jgi:hypothetical protein
MSVDAVNIGPASEPKSVDAPARIPMHTLLGDLADDIDSTKKAMNRYKEVTVIEPLRNLKEDIARLTTEQLEDLQKVADAKENHKLLSYGHIVYSIGYGCLSIIFGSYLMATGQANSEKFIFAGSALLTNTLMDHMGGWAFVSKLVALGNATAEETLKVVLPIATTLSTMFYSFHYLGSLPGPHQELVKSINWFMSWMNVTIQVVNTYASQMLQHAQRRLTMTESNVSVVTMKIEPLNLRNESLTHTAKQINDTLRGGARRIIRGTSAIPMGTE